MRLAALALIPALLSAQIIRTKSRLADGINAIQVERLRADLTYLSSDALEGRLSLQPGSEKAIHWIEEQYRKAGLKPVNGNSYLQPVPLIEYRTDRAKSQLVVTQHGKSTAYHFPDAYGAFPTESKLKGAVLFAGYGITAPELHYDDYATIDAKGKIVLVWDHEPQENDPKSIFNGTGNTRYATTRVKVLNAQQHGALAVLVAAEPNRKHPSNQERMARISGQAQRMQRIASEAIENDEVRIPAYTISDAIAADLLGSTGGDPKQLQAAIDANLQPASALLSDTTVAIDIVNSDKRRANSFNVLGIVEGSDATLRAETIVFSGHYDHDGKSDKGIFHGADDNGSGTVGVVELARAFAVNAVKPRRSLMFAVFAAEERGLLGSYYYVSHPLRPLATTRAVINFDMIGRDETASEQTKGLIEIAPDTTNELNLVGMKYSPDYKSVVEQANQAIGLNLNYKWDDEAALNVYFRSDQFPFALKGIPAMWWFTGFHPDYHQTTDTVDRIDFPKMQKILQLAYMSGFTFADQQSVPAFVANPAGTH